MPAGSGGGNFPNRPRLLTSRLTSLAIISDPFEVRPIKNFRYWHKADILITETDVSYWTDFVDLVG